MTNPHSMASFCERYGGYDGAKKYWGHTTSEEACDLFKLVDRENRYVYSHMRHCPSRGMRNDLKHIEPYENYCEHCKIIYSRVLEKYGVVYERDHLRVSEARCSSVLYEKGNKPTGNFTEPGEGRVVNEMKREGKKYLHRDFHLLGDNALKYCGEVYGYDAVVEFLTDYAKTFFAPQIEEVKKHGMIVLKDWLDRLYRVEEAPEVLHTELDGEVLTVTIDKSPVIEYMHGLNQEPSRYYIEQTRTLYSAIANACDLGFNLEYYNEDGGTKFRFFKRSF